MASFGMGLYQGREMADTEKRRKRTMEVEEAQSKILLDQAKEYFSDLNKDIRRLETEAKHVAAKQGSKKAKATLAEYEAAEMGKAVFDKYLSRIENGDPEAITAAVSELMGGAWTVDPADDDGFEGGLHLINTETGMRKMYIDPVEAAYDIGSLAMGPEGRKARASKIIGGRIEASKEDKKFQQKLMEMREQMRIDLIKSSQEWRSDPYKAWDGTFQQVANEAGWSLDKNNNLFRPDPADPSIPLYASPEEVRKVAERTGKYLNEAYKFNGKVSPHVASFNYRQQETVAAAKKLADEQKALEAAERTKPRGASGSWAEPLTPKQIGIGAVSRGAALPGVVSSQAKNARIGASGSWAATPAGLGSITTEQFFNTLPATDRQELRYDKTSDTIRDRTTNDIITREDLIPAQ